MSTRRARRQRQDASDAERRLWSRLRRAQLDGLSFRRQESIGQYNVDFVCYARRLVVEVDGGQHDWRAASDERRTAWLESPGFRVIRFWNHDVLRDTDTVIERMRAALRDDVV